MLQLDFPEIKKYIKQPQEFNSEIVYLDIPKYKINHLPIPRNCSIIDPNGRLISDLSSIITSLIIVNHNPECTGGFPDYKAFFNDNASKELEKLIAKCGVMTINWFDDALIDMNFSISLSPLIEDLVFYEEIVKQDPSINWIGGYIPIEERAIDLEGTLRQSLDSGGKKEG